MADDKQPDLPSWDIPARPPKPMTPEAFQAWNQEMYRLAVESGAVERRRRDPTRCPVDVRFTLR